MKRLITLSILLLIAASCSRKVTRTVTETSSSAAISTETIRTGESADLSRLTELLTQTLSTRMEMTDSMHIHTHTVTTLDAEGNVTGQTREETADRWRRSSGSETSERGEKRLQSDSTARRSTAHDSGRTEAAQSSEERAEVKTTTQKWYETALARLGAGACIIALGYAVWLAMKRRRAKRRGKKS